jgi:hypothetical protein
VIITLAQNQLCRIWLKFVPKPQAIDMTAIALTVSFTGPLRGRYGMIRIAIAAEAYEAISATLPLGSVGYEAILCRRFKRSRLRRPDSG